MYGNKNNGMNVKYFNKNLKRYSTLRFSLPIETLFDKNIGDANSYQINIVMVFLSIMLIRI